MHLSRQAIQLRQIIAEMLPFRIHKPCITSALASHNQQPTPETRHVDQVAGTLTVPAADFPVPDRWVSKIVKGEYVHFSVFLADFAPHWRPLRSSRVIGVCSWMTGPVQ